MLSTFFLFEGLDPIDNFPRARCGVTVLKYLIKSELFLIFFDVNKKIKLIRAKIGNNFISRTYSKKEARGSNTQKVKN